MTGKLLFHTTPEQVVNLAMIIVLMEAAGLGKNFIVEAFTLAQTDQGVYDLMAMWSAASDPERREIIRDLMASLDDYRCRSYNRTKCLLAHLAEVQHDARHGVVVETLFRRALYGGRKGRRALARLGDCYEADRVRELHGNRPMRRRGERRRRVRRELEQLRAYCALGK